MRKATRDKLEREYCLLRDQSDSGVKTVIGALEKHVREETQRIDRMKAIYALLSADVL